MLLKLPHHPSGGHVGVAPGGLLRTLNSAGGCLSLGLPGKPSISGEAMLSLTLQTSLFSFPGSSSPVLVLMITVWHFMGVISFLPHLNSLRGECCPVVTV